eukprot:5496356-Pleurochrysis_carterae.AAC.1
MTAAFDVPRSEESRQSEEKGEALADSPPPGMYIEVTLAVGESGRTSLILSQTMKEEQAEKESVESS